MKKSLILVMVLIAIAISSLAYATINSVVITQPLTNDVLHGTAVEFNGTFTATGTVADSDLNVSIYMGQISGGVGQRICSNTSLDLAGLTWACKANMNNLNDNSSMSFNITVGNQTGTDGGATQQSSAQIVSITNDDTAPIVRFHSQELNVKTQGSMLADCTDTSDNLDGTPTYQINLVKPSGANASTVITSSTGTFRGADLDQTGQYTLSCTVQDNAPLTTYKGSAAIANPGAANSARATQLITVSGSKLSPNFAEEQGLAGDSSKLTAGAVVVVILAMLVILGRK